MQQPEVISQSTQNASIGQLSLERHRVLRNTYWLLALSLIPAVIGAAIGVNTSFAWLAQHPIAGSLGMFAVILGLLFGVTLTRNSVWGLALLFVFTFVTGWWTGPMLQAALHLKNGAQLIGMAAGGTALIFFSLATYATVSKKDFSFMGNFLFIGLILILIASLANLFFQIPALMLAISAAAVLLFSLLILFDVSRIVNGGETNYVMATLSIYLDVWNLFLHLLNLLMALAGHRD